MNEVREASQLSESADLVNRGENVMLNITYRAVVAASVFGVAEISA
jgi:hypothetical protein